MEGVESRRNPYHKRRKLPVGELEYIIHKEITWLWKPGELMLERGEPEFIFDMPRLVGGGKLLNLGDAYGGSAILLALGLQAYNLEGHVYTVDNYEDYRAEQALKNYEAAGVQNLITQCRGTTDEWADRFKGIKFRFIFIDADHEYEGVRKDWLNYSKMLENKHSLIALHDTNWEGTDKVIREEVDLEKWQRTHWINRIKVYKKRRKKCRPTNINVP